MCKSDIATLMPFYGNGELNIGLERALIIIKCLVTTKVEQEIAPINVDMSASGRSYW